MVGADFLLKEKARDFGVLGFCLSKVFCESFRVANIIKNPGVF